MKTKTFAFALILIAAVFIAGCAELPDCPTCGGEEELGCDDYTFSTCPEGCIAKCVASVCSEDGICTMDCDGSGSCSEFDTSLTIHTARDMARKSACADEGAFKETYVYNENSNTWWIDMDVEKEGCAPACVVNDETGEAEINWRCTGLIEE
ncbi:MAG: hypothetical protein ABIF92_02505 [archaeon]